MAVLHCCIKRRTVSILITQHPQRSTHNLIKRRILYLMQETTPSRSVPLPLAHRGTQTDTDVRIRSDRPVSGTVVPAAIAMLEDPRSNLGQRSNRAMGSIPA